MLADELSVSLRTLYRDVAVLRAQGALIEGEPGVGYVLQPSFFLPPLMFSHAETEALMLGMRWVSTYADRSLAAAANDALAKISAVCLGYELSACSEEEGVFVLRIEWTSKDDHLNGFRKSAQFPPFLAEIRAYVPNIEEMRHYERSELVWSRA